MGWWHLPAYLFPVANVNPYQNAELFGVIRDPYDRMVSEFYYICTLTVRPWRPNQCDRSKLFDVKYMNEWLVRKMRDRAWNSSLAYVADNGHFTPQYDFIYGPNQVRMLDYVLKMNDALADDFQRLMVAFDRPGVQLKKMNALSAVARGDSQTHLDVHNLTAATLRVIHEMYSLDFTSGGYDTRRDDHDQDVAREER